MAEIGIEMFTISGETLEWRLWATFAASLLNLSDSVYGGSIDRMAYTRAVDLQVDALAKELGVMRDTVDAIMFALGRIDHHAPNHPKSTMTRGQWPTT